MAEAWVVNASPLICLAKAGHLALLEEKTVELLVPEAVAAEVLAGPESDPARAALHGGFGRRVQVEQVPDEVLEWSLGPGESAVIAIARAAPGRTAILDDAEARACARALRVPVMGTLGLAVRAHRLGQLESLEQLFRDLRAAGLYLDPRLVEKLLHSRGCP